MQRTSYLLFTPQKGTPPLPTHFGQKKKKCSESSGHILYWKSSLAGPHSLFPVVHGQYLTSRQDFGKVMPWDQFSKHKIERRVVEKYNSPRNKEECHLDTRNIDLFGMTWRRLLANKHAWKVRRNTAEYLYIL